jgi:hypothetical protein
VDIARTRLQNQRIDHATFDRPADVVRWLGAVQAQDFLASLWAVGLRTRGATEPVVAAAIAEGSIVRTWPMRGTLHFVPAEDVRWMLELLTPRVIAASAGRHRQLELDEHAFGRAEDLIVAALEGGKQLARPSLYQILQREGIPTAGSRGLHILAYLAQKQVLCFGERLGKQPTFALLNEWVPSAKRLARDEALGMIAGRYFRSHGPATVQDFAWWAGLKVSDAKLGIELSSPKLGHRVVEGRTLWLAGDAARARRTPPAAHLLPYYDEYTVAYRDRSDVLDPRHARKVAAGGILNPTMVIDGRVVGTWRRDRSKSRLVVALAPFQKLGSTEKASLAAAVEKYAAFLGRAAVLE